uniref:Uncharacterized protein n=1 Tax=Candidatus Kentrum sp. LPFa TaxID=2126335 RepID=A0A450XLU1_9GAMM|nr:MAG: hypothetical protein BECKLPF1236A_GA0070988_101048 [Candidatus Kentron sp. LPFa]VFK30226.1 MAG: hypothetical protein BECKLPF1236C_GA0070990_101058 [Candidatus Kentron sp. LPFa]
MGRRRYLFDENTTPALGDQLRRRRPALEAMSVGEKTAPSKGTLDPDILLWIEAHEFTLVTRNRKSMPAHLHQHLETGAPYSRYFDSTAKGTVARDCRRLATYLGACRRE